MMTNENVSCTGSETAATDVENDFGKSNTAQKIKAAFWKGVGCGIAFCLAIALLIEILD